MRGRLAGGSLSTVTALTFTRLVFDVHIQNGFFLIYSLCPTSDDIRHKLYQRHLLFCHQALG